MLQSFGIDARASIRKKPSFENDKNILDFKNGFSPLPWSIMGKLTTGFDHPPIDLIAMLAAHNVARFVGANAWARHTAQPSHPFSKRKIA